MNPWCWYTISHHVPSIITWATWIPCGWNSLARLWLSARIPKLPIASVEKLALPLIAPVALQCIDIIQRSPGETNVKYKPRKDHSTTRVVLLNCSNSMLREQECTIELCRRASLKFFLCNLQEGLPQPMTTTVHNGHFNIPRPLILDCGEGVGEG